MNFSKPRIVIKGKNSLVGDLLMETPVIRSLKKAYKHLQVVYTAPADSVAHELLKHNPSIDVLTESSFQILPNDSIRELECSDAFAVAVRDGVSMPEAYQRMMRVEAGDIRYDYFHTKEDEELLDTIPLPYGASWEKIIFCCMNSRSCTSNDPKIRTPNKCFTQKIWDAAAEELKSSGYIPVAIGSKNEEERLLPSWPGLKLYGYPLRTVAAALKKARGTITVDCGIRHLTAAAGGNLFCISCAIPLSVIRTVPITENQVVFEEHKSLWSVSSEYITSTAKQVFNL